MKCLECATEMEKITKRGVTIDSCPHCAGLWFDIEEVYEYASRIKPTPSFVPSDDWFSMHTKGIGDTCPCCQNCALEIGGIVGQTYRRCTWCGGIFLSKDSLNAVLNRNRIVADNQGSAGDLVLGGLEVVCFVFDFIGGFSP